MQSPTQQRRVIVKRIKRNRRELKKLWLDASVTSTGKVEGTITQNIGTALGLACAVQLDSLVLISHDAAQSLLWLKRNDPAAYEALIEP